MIYKGKEYKYIKRKDAEKGDLVHITEVNGTKCDDYRFICHVDGGDFIFDERLSVGWCFVIRSDTFKTYRYVKETVPFNVGDTVKVVGVSVTGHDGLVGEKAVVFAMYDDGCIGIDADDYIGIYPTSSLELIGRPIEPIAEELSQTVESNAITLDEANRDKFNEVAEGKVSTKKIAVFAVVEYSFSHQGLVNKKEVDRHRSLDRATAVSEGLNNRNRKRFYSVDVILV